MVAQWESCQKNCVHPVPPWTTRALAKPGCSPSLLSMRQAWVWTLYPRNLEERLRRSWAVTGEENLIIECLEHLGGAVSQGMAQKGLI